MIGDEAPQGRGDEVVPAAQLRASHEDRDRVVEMLRVAAGDGRLTAEELDERLEHALTARTYGELTALTTDLPAVGGLPAVPATTSVMPVAPREVAVIDCRSGNTTREGRWVVPKRMEIQVTSGNVRLDFTEAAISQPTLAIDAQVRSGNLLIVTKPGIVVDTDDVAVRSGNVRVKVPWGSEVPVLLRIAVSGKVGSGNIVARPPRRTFWQWLRRQPMPYAITAR
jgi:hypothetical protein